LTFLFLRRVQKEHYFAALAAATSDRDETSDCVHLTVLSGSLYLIGHFFKFANEYQSKSGGEEFLVLAPIHPVYLTPLEPTPHVIAPNDRRLS